MNTDKILQNVANVENVMFDMERGFMASYTELDEWTMHVLVMYYDLDKGTPFTTVDGNAVSWTDITAAVHEPEQEYGCLCDAYDHGIMGIYTVADDIAGEDARLVVYGTSGCSLGVRYALINGDDEPIWGELPDPKPYQDMYNDKFERAHEQASNTIDEDDEDDIVDYDDDEDDDDEYDYDYDDDEDEDDDQEFMELDFAELQGYLTTCKIESLNAHDEQNWYGEDWWNDKAAQAETDFLNTYGLSWSDYDKLEQEYKRQK